MEPWKHQAEDLEASWKLPAAAIHWEPRLGKSNLIIRTAEKQYDADLINAAVVIAPNGVHLNWTREQLGKHWDRGNTLIIEWQWKRTNTKKFWEELEHAIKYPGFVWFSVNIETLSNKKLLDYLDRFSAARRCLLVLDESHYAKDIKAARTKTLLKLTWPKIFNKKFPQLSAPSRFPFRRTLTGTPTPQGPLDLWSQFYLLNPNILGIRFVSFRARHAKYKANRSVLCRNCGIKDEYKTGGSGGNQFTICTHCGKKQPVEGLLYKTLTGYRNLPEIVRKIQPYTFERKKADCFAFLPKRLFVRENFEMPPEHQKAYDSFRKDLLLRLESGEEITASNALTALLRLQQISRGHIKDEEGNIARLPGDSPAIQRTLDLVTENDGKAIVWCRFIEDVSRLVHEFNTAGIGVIRCDGSTKITDRPELIKQFREDDSAKVWVGTLSTGGTGIDLGAANLMIFYSHGFNLAERLQGLERNYGSTQESNRIEVVDIVAVDTVDKRALDILDKKKDISDQLSVNQFRELIF